MKPPGSSREQPLDLGNWMGRQFLWDFGGHALGDFRMEGLAQVSQYFRRRDDHELIEKIGVRMTIECVGKFAGKPLLGNVMPVGFFHGASGNARTCAGSTRTIAALLARGRIVAGQNPLDNEIDTPGVAFVAQEESLLTIADEEESVVGNMRSWF